MLNEGRFLPGRLLASRYRIIALLGKGGMGEVYRADDLTLGQPVALKFLPDEAARDESVLERFRNEVRVARRISHPNVCRVYDVGEVDGHTFFTMEYVDGEDMASLLRRIGRLPQDKALEIARQLCAGLAAAHAKGVLHRDLKPANLMLDGRGQLVITDFGLAGVAEQIQGAEIRSGTPAYMSPEQLAGKEVSARSDIYALGLVLYEVFTGKRASESAAANLGKGERIFSRPTTVVRDLDPAVERVILQCLETQPSARPASALAVAAALPGGDPLAAALAAGETPSPQLVAASGETAGLSPRLAMACFAAVLAALIATIALNIHFNGLERMPLDMSPEVLTAKAREMVAQLGYEKHPVDSATGLYVNGDLISYIEKTDGPRPDWNRLLANERPAVVQYWYRQSSRDLITTDFRDSLLTPGIVQPTEPPEIVSGMVHLELDPQGRLIHFLAIPPEIDPSTAAASPVDWNQLFALAGLRQSDFQPVPPTWNTLAGGDARAAWTGKWPGSNYPARIEAASLRGKAVFFAVMGEWTKPQRAIGDERTTSGKARDIFAVSFVFLMLFSAAHRARANYRLGRGDREGAARLAIVMFFLEMALWLCQSHLVMSLESLLLFVIAMSTGLFVAGTTWMLYLALEPWVRRNWPRALISWTRLIAGQRRDPIVGRDILFGVMLGLLWILIIQLRTIPMMRLGGPYDFCRAEYLEGGRQALGAWLHEAPSSILGALEFFFALLGLKLLLRNNWLAAIVFVAIFTVLNGGNATYLSVRIPSVILVYAIAVMIVFRFGLVPLMVAIFTVDMLANVPFSADLSMWYMPGSICALLSIVVLAAWGFYYSLGGKPLWRPESA